MGADTAIHVCDSAFAGSDTLVTARVLAEAVAKLPPQDLILCGQRAIDSETGHIGAQLAACMGWPVVTNVVSLQCEEEGNFRLTRLQDDGMVDLACGAGVVATVCRGTDMVRAPSIMGMRRARNAPILRLDRTQLTIPLEEIGDAGSPTRVIRAAKVRYGNRNVGSTDDVAQGAETVLRLMGKESGGHE
jgi:electron transfer flavoprotein beta subunit